MALKPNKHFPRNKIKCSSIELIEMRKVSFCDFKQRFSLYGNIPVVIASVVCKKFIVRP